MKLTTNFTLEELTRTSQPYDNTPTATVTANLKALCEHILQPLRETYGQPIIVTSGYRSPKVNRAVGGAATSQHLKGQAADIRTKSDLPADNKRLFDLIQSLNLPYDQLIDEYGYNWVHVSYRPKGRRQILHIK